MRARGAAGCSGFDWRSGGGRPRAFLLIPLLNCPACPPAEYADICEAAQTASQVGELQAWKNLMKREYR